MTYLPALYVTGVACVIAAVLVLTLARPRLRTAELGSGVSPSPALPAAGRL